MPEKYSRRRKYQTIALEKVLFNGLLLYGFDIFRFKISIDTMDMLKGTPIGQNIRQLPLVRWFTYFWIPNIYSYT